MDRSPRPPARPAGAPGGAAPPSEGPGGLVWGAVVPAGGRGSRMGGTDKPALLLRGRSLLEHLLDGLAPGVPATVVGPERPLALLVARPVAWCREEPPGGGPAAALVAGAPALARLAGGALDVVVVLPGDAPHAAQAVPALLDALAGAPGALSAVAVDAAGRRQVLVAAHRAGALAERAAELRRRPEGPAGVAAARLLPPPDRLVEVRVPEAVLADVDSPADLERLQRLGRAPGPGPA